MVANIRCGEILNDQLRALQDDQAWTGLNQAAQTVLVPTFGSQASNLLESCLSGMFILLQRAGMTMERQARRNSQVWSCGPL